MKYDKNHALLETAIPGLPPPKSGKVRDVFDLGDTLLESGGVGGLVRKEPGQLVLTGGELAFLGGETLLQLTDGRHTVSLGLGTMKRAVVN